MTNHHFGLRGIQSYVHGFLTAATEEEKEEQEVQNTKDEIRYVKQESAATLDRALAKADEAFERAMATRANLASQEERLVNTYGLPT